MTGTLPAKDGKIGSQEIADLRRAGINVRGKRENGPHETR